MVENSIYSDAVTARRLMLDYRQMLGVKGGSEIERRIENHTKFRLNRKTIENWLNNPDSSPSLLTLKIVTRFMQTEHFQSLIPKVRDLLGADERLRRVGTALFELYGAKNVDLPVLISRNSLLAGYWFQSWHRGESVAVNFVKISPVAHHPFSKVVILPYENFAPRGSGLIFPCDASNGFSGYLWLRDGSSKEEVFSLTVGEDGSGQLAFSFSSDGRMARQIDYYSRYDFSAMPADILGVLDDLTQEVPPGPKSQKIKEPSRLFKIRR